jgi:hypothetical protein
MQAHVAEEDDCAFVRLDDHDRSRLLRGPELIGAADALRETMRTPMWGPVVERRARLVDDLRAELGAEAFAACHERGSTRSLDELVPAPATADRVS